MTCSAKPKAGGRDRLLDAAETLFAQKGYDGASIRDITRSAGVELGLSNYHFGTKDELYRQVLLRRAPIMAASLDAELARVLPTGSLEAILEAYAKPHLMHLQGTDSGWRNYIRLAAYTALMLPRIELMEAAAIVYAPVMQRFRTAIGALLPDQGADQMDRAFYIYRMAILSISIDAGAGVTGRPQRGTDQFSALVATMTAVFSRGISSLPRGI